MNSTYQKLKKNCEKSLSGLVSIQILSGSWLEGVIVYIGIVH